jgi:hypothetical protein
MEKLDYTLKEWMKKDHSIKEWKNVFKQIFVIIYRLNIIHKLSNYDVKPDNFMFVNGKLKMIDLGLTYRYIGTERNYISMIYLAHDKYGINIYNTINYLVKKGWNKNKAWKYVNDYKLYKKIFNDGIVDINKIKKWEYPEKIIPFIKELQKSYGKPAKYFLEKYFQDIE